jgi:hypothetical protein
MIYVVIHEESQITIPDGGSGRFMEWMDATSWCNLILLSVTYIDAVQPVVIFYLYFTAPYHSKSSKFLSLNLLR